jgi:hypothetical protein
VGTGFSPRIEGSGAKVGAFVLFDTFHEFGPCIFVQLFIRGPETFFILLWLAKSEVVDRFFKLHRRFVRRVLSDVMVELLEKSSCWLADREKICLITRAGT